MVYPTLTLTPLALSRALPTQRSGSPCKGYGVHTSLKLFKNLGFTPP
jgi:hypothetical protein